MYTDQSQSTKFEKATFLITFIMVCHRSMGCRGWCRGCLCCGRGWQRLCGRGWRWGCLCSRSWQRLCGRGWRWGWGLGVRGRQEGWGLWGWSLHCGWSSGRGWWCTLLDGQRRQLQRYPQGKTSQDMFMKLYILSCFGFACKLVFLCWVGGHFSDTVCAL